MSKGKGALGARLAAGLAYIALALLLAAAVVGSAALLVWCAQTLWGLVAA